MAQPFRPIAGILEQRRTDVERIEGMAGAVHNVAGFIELSDVGEVTVEVNFPVRFIERPAFSFGAEMGENQQILPGQFPTAYGMVLRWNFGIREETGAKFYDGATLIIVSKGAPQQRIVFHWQMEGRALRNPLHTVGSVNQSL